MVIGILQFELLIHDAESLKDKRRVLSSLKDRLRREQLVSVAEVGEPDDMKRAVVGVAVVARDGARAGEVLDHVTEVVRERHDCELGDTTRELLHGRSSADIARSAGQKADEDEASDLAEEMLHLYDQAGPRPAGTDAPKAVGHGPSGQTRTPEEANSKVRAKDPGRREDEAGVNRGRS